MKSASPFASRGAYSLCGYQIALLSSHERWSMCVQPFLKGLSAGLHKLVGNELVGMISEAAF